MAQFEQVFTKPQEAKGFRIKHNAVLEVKTKYSKHTEIDYMNPEQLRGHLFVLGAMYNVSGYYNPEKPEVTFRVLNGILKDGELCDCGNCQ